MGFNRGTKWRRNRISEDRHVDPRILEWQTERSSFIRHGISSVTKFRFDESKIAVVGRSS